MTNEEKRVAILAAYASSYGQGFPMPVAHIARAAGVSHKMAKTTLDRLGLKYETFSSYQFISRGKAFGGRMGKGKTPEWTVLTEMNAARRCRKRREEIERETGTGPKHMRAGAEYPPGAVIRVVCAMCGAWMIICPTTYGHYIRCDDGTVAWICSGCDGVYA